MTLPTTLIGEFIDAAVRDHARAAGLLTAHPDLIDARWLHGETVLHFLAVEGFVEGVQFLAQHGADVNTVNEFGDSPLIDVVALGETDIADLLLRHGADPNARSATRDNALHSAVQSGNDRLVALLLAAGADTRYRTDLGESVFDAVPAAGAERERVLAMLAKHGVAPGVDEPP
jgi:ankyrin repeat protein